eukprot:3045033-Prymnesium_polylepis.1
MCGTNLVIGRGKRACRTGWPVWELEVPPRLRAPQRGGAAGGGARGQTSLPVHALQAAASTTVCA